MATKKEIFEQTLTSAYDSQKYVDFIREMITGVKILAPEKASKPYNTFSAFVENFYHVGEYVDKDGESIGIFAVELKRGESIERARTAQRTFVKSLLTDGGYAGALVAFYSEGGISPINITWRFSFIRMDYEFAKGKIKETLTPAKRYSYLVGEGEPWHTAMDRLYPIFVDDNLPPTLDELEEAFSVETVTKEFFEKYKEKYLEMHDFLEQNEDFARESGIRGFTAEQFTKKLLSQIVFLYFVQKKGWLGVTALPPVMMEREYKNAFFAKGSKSRELVGKVYVKNERGTYDRNAAAIRNLSTEDEEILSTIVKGRPWGTGPKNFMRSIFNECVKRGGNFFDDYLEPLFYTGLNKNRGENAFYPPLHCRIPFLNGGLFEELDNYDWENNDFQIPNEMFSNVDTKGRDADGVLDIFDRYNFTMAEDEPMEREVAVDPEMLGKVFENLLEVKDRKSKGAFYTPREIVHYMCQESLINYLVTKSGISEEDIRKLVLYGEYFKDKDAEKTKRVANKNGNGFHMELDKDKEFEIPSSIFSYKDGVNRIKELDDYLANVKVVDPAVGSGAFPLGMLNEIVKARDTLSTYLTLEMNPFEKKAAYAPGFVGSRSPYDLKAETIKNCIFACDIEPSAADISKLRLWLSLVIDDELSAEGLDGGTFGEHSKPKQLPNLDCNVICGNSLVDSFEGIDLINESDVLKNISGEHQEHLLQAGVDNMITTLISLQERLFYTKEPFEKLEIKKQIQNIYDAIIEEQLKINPELLQKYRDSNKKQSRPFVIWQLYFPKVFKDNGGFDIAIGNPPYIGERKHKEVFKAIKGSSLYNYYLGRMDFFYFFFHLSINILNTGGVCALITTNYFTTALGGKKLRHDIHTRTDVVRMINFNESKVFNSALGQHNMITMLKKTKENTPAVTTCSKVNKVLSSNEINSMLLSGWNADVQLINQEDLFDGEEEYIRMYGVSNDNNPINSVLEKLVANSTDVLGNVCTPLIGLESSLDSVYVLSKDEIEIITKNNPEELKFVKQFFKGSQIHRYETEMESDKWILYLHEQIEDITQLKGIWAYLQENETVIKGRKGANLRGAYRRGNWWVLNTPRLDMDFEDEKIVTHYRTKSLRFALSTTPWYASRDVYYIVKKKSNISLKYILALLNSSLYYQWFFHRGKRKGDTLELYAKPLKEVPIKEISLAEQEQFIKLVDEIIERKKTGQDTTNIERSIDLLVYSLYNLDEEEINLLEANDNRYGII